MTTSWRVAGEDLNTSNVTVTMEPLTLKGDQSIRVQQDKRLHALARRHVIGRDLPIYGFRFRFHGAASDRTVQVNHVRGLIRTNASWTLEAPDEPNQVYFNEGVKALDLVTVSTTLVYGEGLSVIALDVIALEPAPEDAAEAPGGEDTGITRGIAQVVLGFCMVIGEEISFGIFNVGRNDPAPVSEEFVRAEGLLLSDGSAYLGETVAVADGILIDNAAPLSVQWTKNQP